MELIQTSSEKGEASRSVSGTTVVAGSMYDEEAGCKKGCPKRSSWLFWRKQASSEEEETQQSPITRKIEESPNGYAMVANFLCSDRNFLHFRGFLDLRSRVLLDLQFDIECLEKELDAIDQWDKNSGISKRLKCLECKDRDRKASTIDKMPPEFREAGFSRTRPEVMLELRTKLMEFDQVLLSSRDVNGLKRPSNRDHRSVKNWFAAKKPLVADEAEYIHRKEDLVSLHSGRECSGFDGIVEQFLSALDNLLGKFHCRIIKKIFLSPELRDKTTDSRLHYYSPARVDMLVNLVITTIIFVLLIIPVVVLYKLSSGTGAVGSSPSGVISAPGPSPFEAIGILIIFTLLFSGAMSSLTTATRQELFAASAAYCAVLVVFISNFTTQNVTFQQPIAIRTAAG